VRAIREVDPGHQVLVVELEVRRPRRLLLRRLVSAAVIVEVAADAAGLLTRQLVHRVVLVVRGDAVEDLARPVARDTPGRRERLAERAREGAPGDRLSSMSRIMRVSIGPGRTALTRMPCAAHSMDAVRISPISACLLATS